MKFILVLFAVAALVSAQKHQPIKYYDIGPGFTIKGQESENAEQPHEPISLLPAYVTNTNAEPQSAQHNPLGNLVLYGGRGRN